MSCNGSIMSNLRTNSREVPKNLALAAIGLAIFATVLGLISAGDNVLGWDLSLAKWIQQWEDGLGKSLYRVGDVLGTTSLAAIVTGIALIIALVRKQVQIS